MAESEAPAPEILPIRYLRPGLALLATLCFAASPLSAQAEVRFVLVVTGGIPPYIRGELRLTRQGAQWSGTLSVEESDSLLAVTGIRDPADSLLFDTPLLGGMRFAGIHRGDGFQGEAHGTDGVTRSWTANRLNATQEFYPSLPRFTLRQIVLEGTRTPGPVPASLEALLAPASSIGALYRTRSRTGGWTALEGRALARDRGTRALGLTDRATTLNAERATLSAIENGIADPSVRRRFLTLFHPGGIWVVDLHDAAIRSASLALPGFRLEMIRPALAAIGEPGADTASNEHLMTVAYRMTELAFSDSAAFATMIQGIPRNPDQGRRALLALLNGYQDALAWHSAALRFLLTEQWFPATAAGRSVAELVRSLGIGGPDSLPVLRPRLLGYVQAFPHIRIPDAWVDSLIKPENPNGRDWLAHHGRNELLSVLRRIPAAFDTGTVVTDAGAEFRLSTVGHEAALRESGFLEPVDEIVSEAGLSPLLSVQTVVHEWIHILHEHARERAGRAWRIGQGGSAHYQPVTPILAEGFAEWEAERALAPLLATYPLLGIFETEKRAAMALESTDDPHLVGFRLVSGLAARTGEPLLLRLAVAHADDLDALSRDPELRLGRGAPGHAESVAQALLPQTRFTIDEIFPQVIATRIVTPFAAER